MKNSSYSPTQFENCTIPEGQSVAIIIPFRDDDSKGMDDDSRLGFMCIQINFKFELVSSICFFIIQFQF